MRRDEACAGLAGLDEPARADAQAPHAPCDADVTNMAGVAVGRLLGLADAGRVALVVHPLHAGPAALRARSVVDLRAAHVGRDVLLAFERQDPTRPVVLGLLQGQPQWPDDVPPGQVEVEADGERVILCARHELVLRCGKASLVLREDGRIELRGETIVSQAARANRIRGGSVELN